VNKAYAGNQLTLKMAGEPLSRSLWGRCPLHQHGTSGLRGQGELGTAWTGKPGQDKPTGPSGPRRRKNWKYQRVAGPVRWHRTRERTLGARPSTSSVVPGPRRAGWGGTATRKAWLVAALDVPPSPSWTGGRVGRRREPKVRPPARTSQGHVDQPTNQLVLIN
jgi:hypothetical protein